MDFSMNKTILNLLGFSDFTTNQLTTSPGAQEAGLSHRLPPAGAVPIPPQTPATDRRWPVPGPSPPQKPVRGGRK